MKAVVNGEEWELTEGATVGDVLRRLGAPETGIAVACRGEVVPRPSWPDTVVRDGDDIEVLTAVQGG
jgi:sulfur carrier protein